MTMILSLWKPTTVSPGLVPMSIGRALDYESEAWRVVWRSGTPGCT